MVRFSPRFTVALAIALFGLTAQGFGFQTSGSGGSSSSSSSRGSTGSVSSIPVTNSSRNPSTQTFQRPIFIMGKVVMEDGSPLPQRVAIRRTCQGTSTRRETYTDSHGTFSFQIGGIQAMQFSSDASDSNAGMNPNQAANGDPLSSGVGAPSNLTSAGTAQTLEQQIWSCDVTADLPGYRSDVISLAGRHMLDDPNVGTIVLHRIGTVSGSMISLTSMQAPKDARKQFEKARDLMTKGKVPEAQACLEKAVSVYPQYAEAWYRLGQVHEKQKQLDEAHTAYNQSIQADPKFMSPYLSLAELAGLAGNWQEADRMSSKVMEFDGVDFPGAFFINSVANYNLGKFEIAEKSARRAEQLDSQHHNPRVQLILGTLLERKGDYADAASEYRQYLKEAPQAGDASNVQKQLAELEKATAGSPQTAVPQSTSRPPQP